MYTVIFKQFRKLFKPATTPRSYREDGQEHVNTWKKMHRTEAFEFLRECSESYSGYERQTALKALSELQHPGSIKYVLPRLGDWVPQVREEAHHCLCSLINHGFAGELVTHHLLVDQLLRIKRVDLSDIYNHIGHSIRNSDAVNNLILGLDDPWVIKRRFCYQILAEDPSHHPMLIKRSLADHDPTIRLWLTRGVLQGNIVASEDVHLKLIEDPSAIVSTTMLRSLSDTQTRALQNTLIKLCLSPNRTIRYEAIFKLERKCGFDVQQYCRDRLDDRPTPGAIECIGDVGLGSVDIQRVLQYTQHPRTPFRIASIYALGKLTKDEQAIPELLQALTDSNSKVRRTASQAVLSRPRSYWFKPVLNILDEGLLHPQLAAYHMVSTLSGCDALPAHLILLAKHQSYDFQLVGWLGLHRWTRHQGIRGWIKPTPECLELIKKYWAEVDQDMQAPKWMQLDWADIKSTLNALTNHTPEQETE